MFEQAYRFGQVGKYKNPYGHKIVLRSSSNEYRVKIKHFLELRHKSWDI